jgi:hypothetical protein
MCKSPCTILRLLKPGSEFDERNIDDDEAILDCFGILSLTAYERKNYYGMQLRN